MYLDRTFAQRIGSAKVKSQSEVTRCIVLHIQFQSDSWKVEERSGLISASTNYRVVGIYLCFVLGKIIYIVINNGASFCQVDRRRQFIHLVISIVKGYQ